ncbi:hypothetical protein [Pedobacter sp. UYP1]|uniref:hypothetical protein n=1 Tax=Pedobacter sp. UYP1 TaxID=1756396 RepID=UPI003399C498
MDKLNKGNGLHFWKVYNLIASTINLSNSSDIIRRCRFCRKCESDVSFKMKAHAFPELLGANDCISYDECDKCNLLFSSYESHLSKYFLPYLSMVQVKGKKKIPAFTSRTENNEEKTRTVIKSIDGKLKFELGNRDDLVYDHENKKLSIRFRLPPFKPLHVYKALVKIGLSILPTDRLEKYRAVIDWMLGEASVSDYIPIVYITKVVNRKFAEPFAELYEANSIFEKEGFYPELTLVVNFANIVTQIFLPLSAHFDYLRSNQKSPLLEMYPASAIYNQNKEVSKYAKPNDLVKIDYRFEYADLSSAKTVIRDELIYLSYESFERSIK